MAKFGDGQVRNIKKAAAKIESTAMGKEVKAEISRFETNVAVSPPQ